MSQKSQDFLPAYLVVGEDELKRTTVLKRLHERISALGDLSFNYDEFDGASASGDAIVGACNTIPFASDLRLVEVMEAEKLPKAAAEQVIEYLLAPSATTVLALEAEKLAKNTRLYKAVAALGKTAVIDCTPLKRRELPKTIRNMAVGYGVTFTEGAAYKLVELVGENTVRLDTEVKKIASAHRGNDPVNESEVISLVARTSEVKPWEVTDAFSARDISKCLLLFQRMPEKSSYSVMPRIVQRIRELIGVQSFLARGNTSSLSRILKIPEWKVSHYTTWSRNFTDYELREALCLALDAEQAMKSSSDPDKYFVDWLLRTLRRM